VKTNEYFFRHQVHIRRPKLCISGIFIRPSGGGEVIDKGIEPDINHFVRFVCNRNAPAVIGSRYTHIPQSLLNETDHLIPPEFGLQKLRIFLYMLE
jgi:hypothetical protein